MQRHHVCVLASGLGVELPQVAVTVFEVNLQVLPFAFRMNQQGAVFARVVEADWGYQVHATSQFDVYEQGLAYEFGTFGVVDGMVEYELGLVHYTVPHLEVVDAGYEQVGREIFVQIW